MELLSVKCDHHYAIKAPASEMDKGSIKLPATLAGFASKGGSMNHRVAVGLIVGAAVALIFAMAGTAGAVSGSYSTFVGCDDLSESPVPSHVCQVADFPGAYFKSEEEVKYEVCVDFPSEEFLCSSPEVAEAEVTYVNSIESHEAGEYVVVWYLAETETELGSFVFEMKEPPPVQIPPSPPPVVTPAPIVTVPPEVGPSPACNTAQKKERKLTAELSKAKGRVQKSSLRAKLKSARATAKRDC